MSIVIFILVLGLLVLIHEFGHFIVAKLSGVYVEEFGVGFPPRIWGKKIGETLYSINAIPLGGFVKVFGEEYEEVESDKKKELPPALKSRTFVYKKHYIKFLIIAAGVIMNTILGVSVYYSLLSMNRFQSDPIPLIIPYHFRFGTQEGRVVAANIIKGSPADKAGITVEDVIQKYQKGDKVEPGKWTTITSAAQMINAFKGSANENFFLSLENVRNGKQKTVAIKPYYNKDLKRAVIGVNLLDTVILKYQKPYQKLFSGFMHSYNILTYNFTTIGQLIGISVKEKSIEPVSQTVSGPIGIYTVVNDVVKTSGEKVVKNLLNIVGLLSLSLAAMNVLPLPALDGAKLVFIVYEWVSGRRVNKTFERYVNMIGFFLLIALGIVVSINDVVRLVTR